MKIDRYAVSATYLSRWTTSISINIATLDTSLPVNHVSKQANNETGISLRASYARTAWRPSPRRLAMLTAAHRRDDE